MSVGPETQEAGVKFELMGPGAMRDSDMAVADLARRAGVKVRVMRQRIESSGVTVRVLPSGMWLVRLQDAKAHGLLARKTIYLVDGEPCEQPPLGPVTDIDFGDAWDPLARCMVGGGWRIIWNAGDRMTNTVVDGHGSLAPHRPRTLDRG